MIFIFVLDIGNCSDIVGGAYRFYMSVIFYNNLFSRFTNENVLKSLNGRTSEQPRLESLFFMSHSRHGSDKVVAESLAEAWLGRSQDEKSVPARRDSRLECRRGCARYSDYCRCVSIS